MALFGFACLTCGHREPEYVASCPECRGTMSACYSDPDAHVPRQPYEKRAAREGWAQRFDPVTYFVREDGHVAVPGAEDAQPGQGYERRQARTIAEIEALERRCNRQEMDKAERSQHQREVEAAMLRSQTRPGLRSQMRHFTPAGRDFAQRAMDYYDRQRNPLHDPGVHFEVLHFDQSNRDVHLDRRTNWKPRRG